MSKKINVLILSTVIPCMQYLPDILALLKKYVKCIEIIPNRNN